LTQLKKINIITNVLNAVEDHVDRKTIIDAIKRDPAFIPIPNKRDKKVKEHHQFPLTILTILIGHDTNRIKSELTFKRDCNAR
jgi:hypothetical protein